MKDISRSPEMVKARFSMKYRRVRAPGEVSQNLTDSLEGVGVIHEAVKQGFRGSALLFDSTPLEAPKLGRIAKRNLLVFWQELKLCAQKYGGWIGFIRKLYKAAKNRKERR